MQLGCMLRISRMIFMNEYGHQAARLRHMLEAARHMNKLHVVLHDCYGIGMKHVLGCGIRIRVFPIRFTRVTYSRAAAHRDRLGPPVRRAVLRRPAGAGGHAWRGPVRLRQPRRGTAGIGSSGVHSSVLNDFCLL